MEKRTLQRLGLAAVILLAPGGFVLGATLAANHYRRRRARGEPEHDPAASATAASISGPPDPILDQAVAGGRGPK